MLIVWLKRDFWTLKAPFYRLLFTESHSYFFKKKFKWQFLETFEHPDLLSSFTA